MRSRERASHFRSVYAAYARELSDRRSSLGSTRSPRKPGMVSAIARDRDDRAGGALRESATRARSRRRGGSWRRCWRETDNRHLVGTVKNLIHASRVATSFGLNRGLPVCGNERGSDGTGSTLTRADTVRSLASLNRSYFVCNDDYLVSRRGHDQSRRR